MANLHPVSMKARELIAASITEEKLPCHVCGALITREELDENAAYTLDGKPHCPAHYPNE